jgi:hypothetical protein
VKSASYLSSSGRDVSRILAKASRVACPPSVISVVTSVLLSLLSRLTTSGLHPDVVGRRKPQRLAGSTRGRPFVGAGIRIYETDPDALTLVAME